MDQLAIETLDLSKIYKRTHAVDKIHLHVHQGDIYGFIGRNGSGKSTTLKMITGLIHPSEGEVLLFGKERDAYSNKRVGSLIETPGLYPKLSAFANMAIKATAMGVYDKEQISELLSLVGLDPNNKKHVRAFSLGMKQRLGIALALLGNPDLLILDEPINGLDPEGIKEIREVIRYLNETKKVTILISSHILGELSKIATRYGIIRDGMLIEEISASQLDEKCRSYLSVTLDHLQQALPWIEQELHVKDYVVHDERTIWIFDEINSRELNTLLFSKGISVEQMYYQKQDLESYFLEKIGGMENDQHDEGRNTARL